MPNEEVEALIESIRPEIEATGGTITAGGDRYAIVGEDGVVTNTIMWNPQNAFDPGPGNKLILLGDESEVGIGDKVDKDGHVLVKWEPDPAEHEPTIEERVAALEEKNDA